MNCLQVRSECSPSHFAWGWCVRNQILYFWVHHLRRANVVHSSNCSGWTRSILFWWQIVIRYRTWWHVFAFHKCCSSSTNSQSNNKTLNTLGYCRWDLRFQSESLWATMTVWRNHLSFNESNHLPTLLRLWRRMIDVLWYHYFEMQHWTVRVWTIFDRNSNSSVVICSSFCAFLHQSLHIKLFAIF